MYMYISLYKCVHMHVYVSTNVCISMNASHILLSIKYKFLSLPASFTGNPGKASPSVQKQISKQSPIVLVPAPPPSPLRHRPLNTQKTTEGDEKRNTP